MTTIAAAQAFPRPFGDTRRGARRTDVRPDGSPALQVGSVRAAHLEITRRGRLLLTALLFAVVLAASVTALVVLDAPAAIASWGQDQQYVSVTVQPGDTLWSFAQEYAPAGTDPRDYVLTIQQANDLPTSQVTAGAQLDLPVEG